MVILDATQTTVILLWVVVHRLQLKDCRQAWVEGRGLKEIAKCKNFACVCILACTYTEDESSETMSPLWRVLIERDPFLLIWFTVRISLSVKQFPYLLSLQISWITHVAAVAGQPGNPHTQPRRLLSHAAHFRPIGSGERMFSVWLSACTFSESRHPSPTQQQQTRWPTGAYLRTLGMCVRTCVCAHC